MKALAAGDVLPAAVSRAGVGLAVWVLATAALAVPLVAAGWWVPWAAAAVLLVSAVVAVLAARAVPVVAVPAPAAALLLVVAVGAGVWAGLTHAEHVVLRRDAGTYALFGQHLATAHTNRVDVDVPLVGGADVLARPDVTTGSPGFYQQGSGTATHVVPQFLLGTPVWLSIGWWLGGWTALLLVPAIALAAALLALGGLAVRVVGPWWGVAATTAVALSQPVLHAGRSTYSEPFALLLAAAGASVLVAAGTTVRGAAAGRCEARRLGLLAGSLLGGVALVRVDALRETALLLPVAAVLALRRPGSRERAAAGPLVVGLVVSTAVAAAAAAALARPYVASIKGSLLPLGGGLAVLALLAGVVVLLGRRGMRLPVRWRLALPWVLPALVAVIGLALASRPLWLTVRQSPADPGSRVVAGLQLAQGLRVDGGRTYAEHSVGWVVWWLGLPVAVLALVGAVVAARAIGRAWADDDALPPWAAVAMVAAGSTVLTLYRPGITPDHPWADRRLVPVVLPAIVLLAAGALRAAGLLARTLPAARARRARAVLAALGTTALVVPPLLGSLPVAAQRTERGEVAAVRAACSAFAPGDTAVLVDSRAANEWTQVLRGVCDVPTVVVRSTAAVPADARTVLEVARAVVNAGRRPVVVSAGSPDAVARLGARPRKVVDLRTVEDQRLLTRRPEGGAPLDVELWVAPAT